MQLNYVPKHNAVEGSIGIRLKITKIKMNNDRKPIKK